MQCAQFGPSTRNLHRRPVGAPDQMALALVRTRRWPHCRVFVSREHALGPLRMRVQSRDHTPLRGARHERPSRRAHADGAAPYRRFGVRLLPAVASDVESRSWPRPTRGRAQNAPGGGIRKRTGCNARAKCPVTPVIRVIEMPDARPVLAIASAPGTVPPPARSRERRGHRQP